MRDDAPYDRVYKIAALPVDEFAQPVYCARYHFERRRGVYDFTHAGVNTKEENKMDDLTMDDVYGGEFTDDDAQGGGAADTENGNNDSPVDGGSDMDAIYNGTAMEGSQESVDGEGGYGGEGEGELLWVKPRKQFSNQ